MNWRRREAMETIMEETSIVTAMEEGEADGVGLGKEEQKHRFVLLRAKGYLRTASECAESIPGRRDQRVSGEAGAGSPAIYAQGHRANRAGGQAGPVGSCDPIKEIA
jgi:hypothetical protein